jgi:ribulose-5-phosphate 4-epimerase/fuculose-1-phosphate aldolase
VLATSIVLISQQAQHRSSRSIASIALHHRLSTITPAEYTYQRDGVPCGEGEDVGAGDDAGAEGLHGTLGVVDDVEGVQRRVGRAVLLRRHGARGVQQNGAVAALASMRYICRRAGGRIQRTADQ